MQLQNFHFLDSMPDWLIVNVGFISSFIITFSGIPSIVAISRAKHLYDLPNSRDSHYIPTPLLGGVAVYAGVISGTILSYGHFLGTELYYIVLGTTLLLFIGLKDDLLGMAPIKKMIVQIMSSLIIIIFGDIRVTSCYGFLGIDSLPYLASILFTLFVFTLIINAINLIDGIDGLASGISIVISSTLGSWFLIVGYVSYSVLSFTLAGSLAAFLRFNLFSKQNKIFLGDTGSLVIGIIISVISVRFLQTNVNITGSAHIQSAPAVVFGILIFPLFDTLRVFLLRVSQGKSPFSADHQHIHHCLLNSGYTHIQATFTIIIFNISVIGISFVLHDLGNILLILLQMSLAIIFLLFTSVKLKKRAVNASLASHILKIIENQEYKQNKKVS